MNVSLTKKLERFVQQKVRSGRYHSASEVVREGLRMLEERDQLREVTLTEVREKIRSGIDQLDRGLGLDGELAVAELIRRFGESPRKSDEDGSVRSRARRSGRSRGNR